MDSARPRSLGPRSLVAVTACWGVFLLLDRLLSGRWWFWLIPDLAPPLLFLAVPVLLLALAVVTRPSRRWLVPVVVALLLAGLPRTGLNPAALLPGRDRAPGPAFTVFSWNTEYWDTTDDPDAFYRYLRSRDADVYLLQEYLAWVQETPTRIDRLDRIRQEFPGYRVAVLGELVTLSRFPVLATPAVGAALPADTPWEVTFARKKVLRTDVDVHGRAVSLYNVHIPVQVDTRQSVFGGDFYRTVRAADAARREQYTALESDAAANHHPLLIAGDFNTTPAMGDLSGLRARFRDARSASGDLYPGSWGGLLGSDLWRLDWAFTDRRVAVERYSFADQRGMSDHRGQQLRVALRP
ncbi:endonuclease/exonuclease/phosphatase family protein [Kitasatospora sp. NPDC059973]|uniref:endonuclease/exonuclease/phosphatase family protein n=1 Tax=Kitasatospora sp. NPDC059973 TaxID=3347020 RepID=UPI0036BB6817